MFNDNEKLPLVSVIIPCYNHAQFVEESIQSVIDQDYENIELIIIDDGSEDESVNVIKNMVYACEKRFKRFEFRYRTNKGLCATLNEALEWCEGEFFSPFASDDIALPHKTSFLVNKIENSDYAVVFGLVHNFDDCQPSLLSIDKFESSITHNFDELMLQINIPAAPAAMLRRSSVLAVGGYAEDVNLEDRYMWMKLASSNEKLITFSKIVTLYRSHDNNTSKDIRKMHVSRIQVLKKFQSSEIYHKSLKKAYCTLALQLSNEEVLQPIKVIIKSKNYNKGGLKVIIRALVPKKIFVWQKRLRNIKNVDNNN